MLSPLLLAVLGNTPQVITETLFAIANSEGFRKEDWPGSIKVITTTIGKGRAMNLIKDRILENMCLELKVTPPHFMEEDIWVITDAQGNLVLDARTKDDHEALANFIVTKVRNLSDEKNNPENERPIFASIAGGRKTMTFYLGYAMSLFGRPQDKLSHVLVSQNYENHPDFYYPDKNAPALKNIKPKIKGDTSESKLLYPKDAIVELADIPFIQHRETLPQIFTFDDNKPINFRELINWTNAALKKEDIYIKLYSYKMALEVSVPSLDLRKTIHLNILDFAFYQMIARATIAHQNHGDGGGSIMVLRPPSFQGTDAAKKNKKNIEERMAGLLLDEMAVIIGGKVSTEWNLILSLEQKVKLIEKAADNCSDRIGSLRNNTVNSIKGGIKQSWFDTRKNTIKEVFKESWADKFVNAIAACKVDINSKINCYLINLNGSQIEINSDRNALFSEGV